MERHVGGYESFVRCFEVLLPVGWVVHHFARFGEQNVAGRRSDSFHSDGLTYGLCGGQRLSSNANAGFIGQSNLDFFVEHDVTDKRFSFLAKVAHNNDDLSNAELDEFEALMVLS